MKIINKQEALQTIESMGLKYVMEADSLRYLIEDEEDVVCVTGEDMLVTRYQSRGVTYITVIPLHDTFDTDALLAFVKESSVKVSMLINVQSLREEFIKDMDEKLSDAFVHERNLIDYVYHHSAALTPSNHIRLLGTEDKELFVACTQETIQNRPPLAVLFDVFIRRNQGQIFAAFAGEKIVGYLSFNRVAQQVFDVDYIYVVPEMRGRGIGKQLATAYTLYAQDCNHVAYWSNAKNQASERTAISCGFGVIRRVQKYITKDI